VIPSPETIPHCVRPPQRPWASDRGSTLLLDVNAYPPAELLAMSNPVACIFRLERSPTLGTAAIDDLDD
jgi:hypothetical protein